VRGSRSRKTIRDPFSFPAIEGLYPVGEGAGYAGGIVSVDGLRTAKAIVARYWPMARR
jgi:uncharacterized FAD-dependent dehydrogenase